MVFARLALTVALVLALVATARAARDDTTLASRASGTTGAKGNGGSGQPDLSGDGSLVAFHSAASNLAGGDTNGAFDVFVRDAQSATTMLASRASSGAQGNGASSVAAISGNGRFVAFQSVATNLHGADTDPTSDVFVRDLEANTTTLASRNTAGVKGNGASSEPAISADGRFVVFRSIATNLDDDTDATSDVFVRDLQANTTTLVSRATGAAGVKGNGSSFGAAISGDGRMVAFSTDADNLGDDPGGLANDVYVRDLQASTTALVSRASGASGPKGNSDSVFPDVSADGRFVAFPSRSTNLGPEATPGVFVRDRQTATTALVSRASGAAGALPNGLTDTATISADGRYIAFRSEATNLHPDDTETGSDLFVRDRQDALTSLVTRASGTAGANGNGPSTQPALSGDGAFVGFESSSTNLHPDDGDTTLDVFTRQLLGAAQPTPTPSGGGPAPPPGVTRSLAPVIGRSQLVAPVSGVVRVRRRGARRFVRLRAGRLLPDRSEIDTTRGVVRVVVATAGGRTESALVSEGRAIIDQNTAARPTTTLRLSLPLACRRSRGASASARRRRAKRRGLFTRTDGGRFRTRGNHAAATASGTAWRTTDRCRRTRIDVREGTVRVRDLRKRRTIVVRAPGRYVARRR